MFQAWPEAPQVETAEQRGLSLPGSLEQRYQVWRETADGKAVFGWLAERSVAAVAAGATKLFIDRMVWPCRQELGLSINNSYRALLVRELIDRYPTLRGAFELRQRTSVS